MLALAAWLLSVRICLAQDTLPPVKPWSGFGIEVNPILGKVVKHEAKFKLPIPALTTGFDINFMLHTYGAKAWEQDCRYPTLGLAIAYINYGIDSIYGKCIGLYPNITLPLYRGKKLQWDVRLGDGIGYVTKRYQRTAPVNTINNAIGSHINDFGMFMTDLRYRINEHWDMQLGGSLTHISDASFRKPNLGINMFAGHFGLRYFPVTSQPRRIVRPTAVLSRRWLAQARASMAMVSSYTAGGPVLPVYIASGYASKRWRNNKKAHFGIDYSYHENIYAFLRNTDSLRGKERANSYKTALFAGNEFMLGRLGIVLQVGYYLQQSAIKLDPLYQKIGGQYYLLQRERGPLKEVFISAFLKVHQSVAELGEIGLGVGF